MFWPRWVFALWCLWAGEWLANGAPTRMPTRRPTSAMPTKMPTPAPTNPTGAPTRIPSSQPSSQPTLQPSRCPSGQPTRQPSRQPTRQPSRCPSGQPTGQPSRQPTGQPTRQPTNPTGQPTCQPSRQPLAFPTGQPSLQPSGHPNAQPSGVPTSQPTSQPSSCPTSQPSRQPTNPTGQPTTQPTRQPTGQPSRQPTQQPTGQPSRLPTGQPTRQPSRQPTGQPSRQPTRQPTQQPTNPTGQPSRQPTRQPTGQPSRQPTQQPTGRPSCQPSRQPTGQPSCQPTGAPTNPTGQPTRQPSAQPTRQPTGQPTNPTGQPTRQPTGQPSRQPTRQPTGQPSSSKPSGQPSRSPTGQPSMKPTAGPTIPTGQPSKQPTGQPSRQPTGQPTRQPTAQPSTIPTRQPTSQPSRQPTRQPTGQPSRQPTSQPSRKPSRQPTSQPSSQPTEEPSMQPSTRPSSQPSGQPSAQPSCQPTRQPTRQPTGQPTRQPSRQPTRQPTIHPTGQPSSQPSMEPSGQPTSEPTVQPSSQPTSQPSRQPTRQPSSQPSRQPTRQPTQRPTRQPTCQPSRQPTCQPTVRPSSNPTSSSPTSRPSSRPSKYPSTSPPSGFDETTDPTSTPTSVPTVYYSDYMYQVAWSAFVSQKSAMISATGKNPPGNVTGGLYFNSFNYKGYQPEGDCSAWRTFITQAIALPNENLYLSYAKLYIGLQSTTSRIVRSVTFECFDSSILMMLRRALMFGLDYVGRCNDRDWRVYTCSDSVVFCIDCVRACSATACPGNGMPNAAPLNGRYTPKWLVNPCPKTTFGTHLDCSNQYSTFVNLRFDVTERIDFPALGPIDVVEQKKSLIVTTSVTRPANVYCTAVKHIFTSREILLSRLTFDPTGFPTGKPSRQPTRQPTMQPSRQPTRRPTRQPTSRPTTNPTNPTGQPTRQPSRQPTGQPTGHPTLLAQNPKKTKTPTGQPTRQPSRQPTRQPTRRPTGQPSRQPSRQPTSEPTAKPTSRRIRYSHFPTLKPTGQPTSRPSRLPTARPSSIPSQQPTALPTALPTQPTGQPTAMPSIPTGAPTQPPGDEIFYSYPQIYSIFDVKRIGPGSAHVEVLDYSQPVTMVLPGLWTDIPYRVYCYSEDVLLHGMNLPAVRENFIDTKTLCCKGLKWTNPKWENSYTTLVAGGAKNYYHFSFAFTSPPSYNQYFQAFVAPSRFCPSSSPTTTAVLARVEPALFNISQGSIDLVRSFKVFTDVPGCFEVLIFESALVTIPKSVRSNRYDATLKRNVTTISTIYVESIIMAPTLAPSSVPTLRPSPKPTMPWPTPAPSKPSPTPYPIRGANPSPPTMRPTPSPTTPTTPPTPVPSGAPTPMPTKKNLRPYSISVIVSIQPAGTPYEPPQLSACYFSDDGLFLLCDFDMPTDRAMLALPTAYMSAFPCATLLDFPTSNYVTCEWASDITIRARLAAAAVFLANNKIDQLPYDIANPAMVALKPGVLRSACQTATDCGSVSKYPYSSGSSAYVDPTDNPALPSASLSIVPIIGYCDDLKLDATASQGSAGRPWSNLIWLLSGVDDGQYQNNVTQLAYNQYMNTVFNTTSNVWTVPRQLVNFLVSIDDSVSTVGNFSLPMNTPITFSVLTTNFLGASSVTSASTTLSTQALLPSVRILGLNSFPLSRDSPLALTTQVSVPSWCGPLEFNTTGSMKIGELVVEIPGGTKNIAIGSRIFGPKAFIVPGAWVKARTGGSIVMSAGAYRTGANIPLKFRYPVGFSLRYEYRWAVYQGFKFIPVFPSESLDPRAFKISPFKMITNQRYYVKSLVTVDMVRDRDSVIIDSALASSMVTVDIVPAGVKAVIAGGGSLFINPSQISLLTLDGSGSYDKDYPLGTKSPNALQFKWNCIIYAPVYGGGCPFWANGTTSTISIPAKQLVPTQTYTFLLLVQNSIGAQDNATVRVTVVPPNVNVPKVYLPAHPDKYNSMDKVVLEAYISTGGVRRVAGVSYSWSAMQGSTSIDLASTALTPVASSISVSATPSLVQFALEKNALQAGQMYQFTLTASFTDELNSGRNSQYPQWVQARAVLSVVINAPPAGGVFDVTPSSGVAISTTFNFRATSWLDDPADYPLQFMMSYYLTGRGVDAVLVSSLSTRALVPALVSAGVLGNNNGVTAACDVVDVYGATHTATFPVVVLPNTDPLDSITATAVAAISTAMTSKDISSVRQVIAGLTAHVNAANCNNVPASGPRACDTLNRNQCSTVDNTCGECLDGYQGLSGPSNTPCVSTANLLALLPLGATCSSGAQCASSVCSNQACASRAKACPSNCEAPVTNLNSGIVTFVKRGTCNYFAGFIEPHFPNNATLLLGLKAPAYVPNAVPISFCGDTNATCTAMCICQSGYYGQSCGLTNATLAANRAARASMCSAITNVLDLEDPAPDVLQARAANIASILIDLSQLTLYSIEECTYALIDTVEQFPVESAADSSFTKIMSTLSSVLQLDTLLGQQFKLDVLQAVQTLATARQSEMTVNEAGATVVSSTARIWVSKVATGSSNDFNGAVATVPLTAMEAAAGSVAASITFGAKSRRVLESESEPQPADAQSSSSSSSEMRQASSVSETDLDTAESRSLQTSTSNAGVVGVTLVQYVNHPDNVPTNSTPFTLQMHFYDYDGLATPDLSSVLDQTFVTLTLVNRFSFRYSRRDVETVVLDCESKADPFPIEAQCSLFPDFNPFYGECPGHWRFGLLYAKCPSKFEVPGCALWDASQGKYVINHRCKLLSYDQDTTTCECPLGAIPHSRRLLGQRHDAVFLDGVELDRNAMRFLGALSDSVGDGEGESESESERSSLRLARQRRRALPLSSAAALGGRELRTSVSSISLWRESRTAQRPDPEGSLVANEQPQNDYTPQQAYVAHDHQGVGFETETEDKHDEVEVGRGAGGAHASEGDMLDEARRRLQSLAMSESHSTATESAEQKEMQEALRPFARPSRNSRGRKLVAVAVVSFDFASNFEIQGTNFDQVFEENGLHLIESVEKDALIFTTCILLLIAGLVGFVGFFASDYRTTFYVNPRYKTFEDFYKLPTVRSFESFFAKVLPKEFEPKPWFRRVYNKMLTDHDWLVLVLGGFDEDRDFKLAKWCILVGKVLNFMIADIFLGLVFFADDGSCQKLETVETCETTLAIDRVTPVCEWVYPYRSCRFRPVVKKFAMTIVITMIITVFASIFDKLLRFLVGQTRRFCERMPKLLGEGNKLTVDRELGDEMKDIQSKPTTILRAARLQWMIQNMDFVPADEELRIMVENSTRGSWLPGDWRPTATNNYLRAIQRDIKTRLLKFDEPGDPRSASELMHHALSNSRQFIQRKLQRARMRAEAVKLTLSTIRLDQDKDLFLIRRFLVDSLPGYRRLVAQHYFFQKEETEEFYKDQPLYVLKICAGSLALYYIIATTIVLLFGVGIGSKATTLWLFGVLTALAQDMFLLQPLRIVVKFVFITNSVSAELLALFEVLAIRARSLTKRQFGLMKNKNALIQHFNPACRAARCSPTLPAARFLMSLTDYDLPITHKITPLLPKREYRRPLVVGMPPRDVAWYSWQRIVASPLWTDLYHATALNTYYALRSAYDRFMWALFFAMSAFLTVLMFLPDPVQTIIEESLVTVLANLTFLAFFYSQAKVSSLFCAVLVAIAVCVIIYLWLKVYIYDRASARAERKKRLTFNEAVRARRAYKKYLAEGTFSDEANREKGYFFRERDPLASPLRLPNIGEDDDDDDWEESKTGGPSKPKPGQKLDLALSFSSFPFSSPTRSAKVYAGDGENSVSLDVSKSPPASPSAAAAASSSFSFGGLFSSSAGSNAAAADANVSGKADPLQQTINIPAPPPPPESNSLVDIVRRRVASLRTLPGFSSIPVDSMREGIRNVYNWTLRVGGADPPRSVPEPAKIVLPESQAFMTGPSGNKLDSHSKFKSVNGPPLPSKKPPTKHNLISELSMFGDRAAKHSTNPYITALAGGGSGSPKARTADVMASIDAAASSALSDFADKESRRRASRERRQSRERGRSGGGGGGGGDDSSSGLSTDEDAEASLESSVKTPVVMADGTQRVKKHGKHRLPFKPKSMSAGDDPSVLTADSASTSSLQKKVRRVLRAHIGPGRVALSETDNAKAFTEAMGEDQAVNMLIAPAKMIHGELPGSTVLKPDMFGDMMVQPGMPEPTASPTTRSPKKGLSQKQKAPKQQTHDVGGLSVSDGRPMSTGEARDRRRAASPDELKRPQLLNPGSPLPGQAGFSGTNFGDSLSSIGGSAKGSPVGWGTSSSGGAGFGATGNSSPARATGGFVAAGVIHEGGRSFEYSTLRNHKQRVIRTLTSMQQESPDLEIHKADSQDPVFIRKLAERQAERDATQRAQDASKIMTQRGVAFIPPAAVPSPIRPVPPPKVVQHEPAKLAFTEKEEPPSFPLYY